MRPGIIVKLYFSASLLSIFYRGQIQELQKWWASCYALVRRLTCRRSLCLATSEKNSLRWISSAEKRHAYSNPNRNSSLWIPLQCLSCVSAWLAAYPVNNDELLKVFTKHQEADFFKWGKMNVFNHNLFSLKGLPVEFSDREKRKFNIYPAAIRNQQISTNLIAYLYFFFC